MCLFLDSFLHLITLKPDLCVLNPTMASVESQLHCCPHREVISPGGTSVHLSWSFLSLFTVLEQHLLGLNSCPGTPALEISSKSFLLFIHLSGQDTLVHEATWALLEREHVNLNWKSSIQPIFGCLLSIPGGNKEPKSKSLQTWVGFLNVLIFVVRKNLMKNEANPCHGCNLNSYLGTFC